MVAERDGNLEANRKNRKVWETFTVVKLRNATFALKSAHGRYLSARKDRYIDARGKYAKRRSQAFTAVDIDGKYVALKTVGNGGLYIYANTNEHIMAKNNTMGMDHMWIVECLL